MINSLICSLREVLDEFSFRQLMNSFALFHEEALSAIDMVRLFNISTKKYTLQCSILYSYI